MSYSPDLGRVSVMVKTFLRDQHLFNCVSGLRRCMPEARLIVVDDGERSAQKAALYEGLLSSGHAVIEMPFDSGFGAKSNAAIEPAQERPYLLVGSDDFDFSPPSVRRGVERLVTVLDNEPDAAVASGRVNGYRYEGWLQDHGDRVVEKYISLDNPRSVHGVTYHFCELTVNYSLVRSFILGRGTGQVHWDDDVKIGGGEHGAWFLDLKRRVGPARVAWVTGVDVAEQSGVPTDRRYSAFRGRARDPGRPCFRRRGVREYVMFGGGVERA